MSSILNDVKKALNLEADYPAFDPEITMHINSVLSTLNQLGIGPTAGFFIEDAAAEWADFFGDDPRFNFLKTYVYRKTRLVFDPPATSFLLTAYQEQIREDEWRATALADQIKAEALVVILPEV